jgi:hypothetical protein
VTHPLPDNPDALTEAWVRYPDLAQRGSDLLSLGALRWSCRYGQAGARIAKLISIRVPEIANVRP